MRKWDVIRVFCDFLTRPHDKFCICICPEQRWFMWFNSEPPQFRKARQIAVQVSNFEAMFLTHTSYLDTTKLVCLSDDVLAPALADPKRAAGSLPRSIRDRIVVMVESHDVMPDDQRKAVTE